MAVRLIECDQDVPREIADEFREFTQDFLTASLEWARALSRDCQDLIRRCVVCATQGDMCDDCRAAMGRVLEMTRQHYELEGRRRAAHKKYQEWMQAHGKKRESYDA